VHDSMAVFTTSGGIVSISRAPDFGRTAGRPGSDCPQSRTATPARSGRRRRPIGHGRRMTSRHDAGSILEMADQADPAAPHVQAGAERRHDVHDAVARTECHHV
jgi:hypothetical protein